MNGNIHEKDRIIKKLTILIIVYGLFAVVEYVNWSGIVYVIAPNDNKFSYIILSIFTVAGEIIRGACVIFLLISFKRLRQSATTRKHYSVLLSIASADIILSFLYYIALGAGYFLFPDAADKMNITVEKLTFVQNIYTAVIYFAPLPFYIAILKEEKLDINWMAIGTLAGLYMYVVREIIYFVRRFSGYTITTFAWYSTNYPVIAAYADSRMLINLSGYFWVMGIAYMVYIFSKKKHRTI